MSDRGRERTTIHGRHLPKRGSGESEPRRKFHVTVDANCWVRPTVAWTLSQGAFISSRSSALPAAQSPRPESSLMWPAHSTTTRRLPHDMANISARLSSTRGSLLLATTILGNGKGRRGIGLNPRTAAGVWAGESTSEGETKSAAFTSCPYILDQCATNAHPRLWATRTGGTMQLKTACCRVSIQSTRQGFPPSR